MEVYKDLSIHELSELLSKNIAQYTERYFNGESVENLSSLRKNISDLIIEIEKRKREKS